MDQPREDKGVIFNIQRFSIHDGPGIRTTVFMKGCGLDCQWCANPESKEIRPNLIVREVNCVNCGKCLAACPRQAISLSPGRAIDWEKCDQCLACVAACLYKSLNKSGEEMTIAQVMDEITADQVFYETSGGGVTVSGGEPLNQSGFVGALLKTCKERGLNTALDTSGYAAWSNFAAVLPYTDLVLFDVKHMDPARHLEGTGASNELILENLKKAALTNEIWLRVPLIAGYNDSEENIEHIARAAVTLNIKRISLLPYHEGGKAKSGQLGKPYLLQDAKAPADETVRQLALLCKGAGLETGVGS